MTGALQLGQPVGQGWPQIIDLLIALVLSSFIGLERELKHKSAGMRTHTLVGLGAALFMLVSKYGFTDVLREGEVILDPSRVAAQIVSGIGFIGGGLIFVRRDVVRGLTTAAVVWVTAAVGSACGADLPILAAIITAAHFLVVYGYPPLVRVLTRTRPVSSMITLSYTDGRGVLRDILGIATGSGYTVAEVHTERRTGEPAYTKGREQEGTVAAPNLIDLRLRLTGKRPIEELGTMLSEVDGVQSVNFGDIDDTSE